MQIDKYKKLIDFNLVLLLKEDLENLRRVFSENLNDKNETLYLEEKIKKLIAFNGTLINDLNSYITTIDQKIA